LGKGDVSMCHVFADVKTFEAQLIALGPYIYEGNIINFIY